MLPPGRRVREQLAGLATTRGPAGARPHVGLPDRGRRRRSECRSGAAGDQRLRSPTAAALAATSELADDGSTRAAAGSTAASTPTASTRPRGAGRAGADLGRARVGLGVADEPAHPLQPRLAPIPDGRPWSERKRYVWWDEGRPEVDRRTTCPTSSADKPPDYKPPEGATGRGRAARRRAVHHAGRRPGWLFAPAGLSTGRCRRTTSRRSRRSTTRSTGSSPTRRACSRAARDNPYNRAGDAALPLRLHDLPPDRAPHRGRMSRWFPYLSELQPELFCEVSPELAARARARARRLGDDLDAARRDRGAGARHRAHAPLRVDGRVVHQVGLPYHWGSTGSRRGDSANDLFALALDPNVHIQRVQGARPATSGRAAAARPALDAWSRIPQAAGCRRAARREPRMGFFTDTTRVHRLQGVRGRVQGVERRARGRPRVHRPLRQHRRAGRGHLAPRGLHRAARASGSTTTADCSAG